MLKLAPAPPPPISFASLCREFGRAIAQLTVDSLRFGAAAFVVWVIAHLLGFRL